MARKFLQMGFTRSRRYANHKSGKKYSTEDKENASIPTHIPHYQDPRNQHHFVITKTKKILPLDPDSQKAESAHIFYKKYLQAKNSGKRSMDERIMKNLFISFL